MLLNRLKGTPLHSLWWFLKGNAFQDELTDTWLQPRRVWNSPALLFTLYVLKTPCVLPSAMSLLLQEGVLGENSLEPETPGRSAKCWRSLKGWRSLKAMKSLRLKRKLTAAGFFIMESPERMLRWRLWIYSRVGPRNLSLNNNLNTTNHFNKRSPGDAAAQPSICLALGQPPRLAEPPEIFPNLLSKTPSSTAAWLASSFLYPLTTLARKQRAQKARNTCSDGLAPRKEMIHTGLAARDAGACVLSPWTRRPSGRQSFRVSKSRWRFRHWESYWFFLW